MKHLRTVRLTLAGSGDVAYSPAVPMSGANGCGASVVMQQLTGSTPDVNVTLQVSMDKENWSEPSIGPAASQDVADVCRGTEFKLVRRMGVQPARLASEVRRGRRLRRMVFTSDSAMIFARFPIVLWLLCGSCVAPIATSAADAWRDISVFLVDNAESYRWERKEADQSGDDFWGDWADWDVEARCASHFRASEALGYGTADEIVVRRWCTRRFPAERWLHEPPERVVGEYRLFQEEGWLGTEWRTVVGARTLVIATSQSLLEQALRRTVHLDRLLASLDLTPADLEAPTTIVHRRPVDDMSPSWSPLTGRAPPGLVLRGHVVQWARGRLRIGVWASDAGQAAGYYRSTVCGLWPSLRWSLVTRDGRAELEATISRHEPGMNLMLDVLYGYQIQI